MKIFFSLMVILLLFVGTMGCSNASKAKKDSVTNNIKNDTLVIYANNMSSFNEIINSGTPILVDFYADWCAPCRMVAPILEQVAADMKGDVKILKVNVDKNREAAQKYGIQNIPTLMLFKNGEVRWKGVGVMQADQIKQIVKTKGN
ncbi:MAG: thioredoxin [Prolixibacteraceae bacterium]